MTLPPDPDPNKKQDDPSLKGKLSETIDKLKNKEGFDNLYTYAKSNTRDTIAYVVLVIGLILLFFQPFWGGVLIGLVVGIFFSHEIVHLVKNFNEFVDQQGMVRSLVLGALLLALFISAPAIFIGILIAVLLKQLIDTESAKK